MNFNSFFCVRVETRFRGTNTTIEVYIHYTDSVASF